jgi:hypothetical protein
MEPVGCTFARTGRTSLVAVKVRFPVPVALPKHDGSVTVMSTQKLLLSSETTRFHASVAPVALKVNVAVFPDTVPATEVPASSVTTKEVPD